MSGAGEPVVWAAIVAVALGTWLFRLSFVILFGYLESIPPRADRVLRLIPAAVIAAIIGPSLLLIEGSLAIAPDNEQLLAGLVALVAAWYTEDMFATIVVGMLALWTLVFVV